MKRERGSEERCEEGIREKKKEKEPRKNGKNRGTSGNERKRNLWILKREENKKEMTRQ